MGNVVRFCRALRPLGFAVGTETIAAALEALELVGLERREDVYVTLRSLLVHRADQLELFDEAFRLFWRRLQGVGPNADLAELTLGASIARQALRRRLDEAARKHPWLVGELDGARVAAGPHGTPGRDRHAGGEGEPGPASQARAPAEGQRAQPTDSRASETPGALAARAGYSPAEVLRDAELAALDPRERRELARLLARIGRGPMHRARRRRHGRRGPEWDLARSARRALATAGELVTLVQRRRRRVARPVVVLLDISGSMETYARAWLAAAYGLTRRWDAVEVFAFGTRLTRLTPSLRRHPPDRALAEAAARVADWAGGTRIGESLRDFNRRWGRRVLRRRAAVLLVSDGWDRGQLELLRREVARLQPRCGRLIWVTPFPLRPSAGGMTSGLAAALAYVDELVSVARVADLEHLAEWLAGQATQPGASLSGRSSLRPQRPALASALELARSRRGAPAAQGPPEGAG